MNGRAVIRGNTVYLYLYIYTITMHCRADMTSFSAGGQGLGSEEGVVHHGEMMNVKQDSMCQIIRIFMTYVINRSARDASG